MFEAGISRTLRGLFATIGLVAVAAVPSLAQAKEQYFGIPSYRVGPFAAGGTGFFGGIIDYLQYVNMKEGGVNGVQMSWTECETEYNAARGVECYQRLLKKGDQQMHIFEPLATPIAYGVLNRVDDDKVVLTTVHAAKGLEFMGVVVAGLSVSLRLCRSHLVCRLPFHDHSRMAAPFFPLAVSAPTTHLEYPMAESLGSLDLVWWLCRHLPVGEALGFAASCSAFCLVAPDHYGWSGHF
jgi:hypothetical protein